MNSNLQGYAFSEKLRFSARRPSNTTELFSLSKKIEKIFLSDDTFRALFTLIYSIEEKKRSL